MDRERPQGTGAGAQTHLPPNPYQALGLGGRSRHGPSRPCATAYRAAEPQDVAALQDKQDGRCASPEGQSVKRPPTSFAHSSAAVRRSAGTVPRAPVWRTPFSRRGRHTLPVADRVKARPPRRKYVKGRPGQSAGKPVFPRLAGAMVSDSTTSSTSSGTIKFCRAGCPATGRRRVRWKVT